MTVSAPTEEVVARVVEGRRRIGDELRKVVVGQDEAVDQLLIALFTGGHCLLTGVPGLAKTLLIRTLAEILDLSFKRIQFTPDLMPADITGTEILDDTGGARALRFVHGPIFAHDPARRRDQPHAAQDAGGAARGDAGVPRHRRRPRRTTLELPFLVLATQNPIELEGTYPLPEAQLDRFMFNIVMDYLSEDDEVKVVTGDDRRRARRSRSGSSAAPTSWRSSRSCGTSPCRTRSRATPCGSSTRRGRRGRTPGTSSRKWVKWGAGLRASQALILAGKARALLAGRFHVSVADIRALAPSVLRHRIITTFYADAEQVTPDARDRAAASRPCPAPKSGL